jgi:hypothetical protein
MGNLWSGAVWASMGALVGALGSADAAAAGTSGAAWIVTPGEAVCRTEIDLVSRSGATVPIQLQSDGQQVALLFAKDDIPASAFLPIRIDQKPFANLVQRSVDGKSATMVLSDATLAALRRGTILQVAWLTDEIVKASLGGSEQGVVDLRTCGAQVAGQHRARVAAQQEQQARAEADARAKAVADEQLATARAQTAAAEAERQRVAAEALRASADADRLSAEADRQRAAMAESQRQQAQQAQAAQWDNAQAPQTWTPYRQRVYRGRAYYPDDDYDNN